MSTSIYLSGKEVQVVKGSVTRDKVVISSSERRPLPDGALINGVITNSDSVAAVLDRMRTDGLLSDKKLRLVVDSSLFMVKLVELPKLNEKKLLRLARNEMLEFEEGHGELIYDYTDLGATEDGKHQRVLCCAVERKFVESYAEVFDGLALKLEAIDLSLNCVLKLVRLIDALQQKTFILSVMDGNNMTAALFQNGVYAFSNRSRLLAEPDTPNFGAELAGKISSFVQFNQSEKSPYSIEAAYFCGLGSESLPFYRDIHETLGIEAGPLPAFPQVDRSAGDDGSYRLSDFLFATGGLIRK